MDLNEVFGDDDPVAYCMGNDSIYSENFVVLRFGDDFLSDLTVLREFLNDSSLSTENVDLIFNSQMDASAFGADELQIYNPGKYGSNNEYHVLKTSLNDSFDFFSSHYEDAQSFGPCVVGGDFLIGFGTSWVVFYSPEVALVAALKELATARYGFIYSAVNGNGHAVLGRLQDDLGTHFHCKAPLSTIRYLPASLSPNHWRAFPDAGLALLNYQIRSLENFVRFHVDIEDASVEIHRIFEAMGIPVRSTMVYHGVTAQRLEHNYLLSEAVCADDDEAVLQSFVLPVEDVISYYDAHQEEIILDRPIFFGEGFAFGSYDQGTDFVFFDVNLRVQFEYVLRTFGYEPNSWWWEKPDND